jgi:CheY-like chemotaxis protein
MHYILVVDANSATRRLLSTTLASQYEIIEADNGIAALYAIQKFHPEVVLLDVVMPGEIDGLQVLDAIKSDPKTRDIPVAMITARGLPVDQQDAKRRGANAYFVKPFSPQQVGSWVQSIAH